MILGMAFKNPQVKFITPSPAFLHKRAICSDIFAPGVVNKKNRLSVNDQQCMLFLIYRRFTVFVRARRAFKED
jgi:hypothetical protein